MRVFRSPLVAFGTVFWLIVTALVVINATLSQGTSSGVDWLTIMLADEIFGPTMIMFEGTSAPRGPEGVKQFMSWFTSAVFPDVRAVIQDLVAEGDKVFARVTLEGTQTNPIAFIPGFDPIPATGNRFIIWEYVLWRVENGKIVERWLLVNDLNLLRQLGASRFTAHFGDATG